MGLGISRGHDLRLHLLPPATRPEGVPFGDQIVSRASSDRSCVNPTIRENAERPTAKKNMGMRQRRSTYFLGYSLQRERRGSAARPGKQNGGNRHAPGRLSE